MECTPVPIETNQYFFGNSLVNFSEGGSQTNLPYWLNQLTLEAGGTYNVNGGFGFLRQFADRLEPANEWGFQGITGEWDDDSERFADQAFSQVVITPGNFIQDLAPTANYPDGNISPVGATESILATVLTDQPNAQIFIYQGWSDLAAFSETFPPSESSIERYYDYNQEDYHTWFIDYVDTLNASTPDANITLIPVAPVLASLLEDGGPLAAINTTDLFTDSAPHGTETTYFLASLITYQATNGESAPASFDVPANIHPLVVENYTELLDYIEVQTTNYMDMVVSTPALGPELEPETPAEETPAEETPEEETPEEPIVAPEAAPTPDVAPEPAPLPAPEAEVVSPSEPELAPEDTPQPETPQEAERAPALEQPPVSDTNLEPPAETETETETETWRGQELEQGVTVADMMAAEALYCTPEQIAEAEAFYAAEQSADLGFPTVPMSTFYAQESPYNGSEEDESAPLSASLKSIVTDIL